MKGTTTPITDADDPRLAGLIAIYQASSVIGFAIVFVPVGEDFWLLEYMAVDAAERSGGHGYAIFMDVAEGAGPDRLGVLEQSMAAASMAHCLESLPEPLQRKWRQPLRLARKLRRMGPKCTLGPLPGMQEAY
jgi:hypothetical protein